MAHCKLVLRSAMVLGTGFVAVSCPSFGTFISLVGSSICALLALILPALFHLVLLAQDKGFQTASMASMGLDVFLLCFGFAFGAMGTMDAAERLSAPSPP